MSVRETVAPELTRILPEPLRAALLPYAVARKMNVGCLAYDLLESCERFSFVNMVLDYSMTIPPVAWPQSEDQPRIHQMKLSRSPSCRRRSVLSL